MRFTGSNVKKLIVQSSARTVRRKSFYCIQAVSAATSDKKRMLFILEIQPFTPVFSLSENNIRPLRTARLEASQGEFFDEAP